MKLNKLEKIIFRISFIVLVLLFLTNCGQLPLVTLHQLDTKHGVANPFKITKYNEDTCKLEVTSEPSFQIISPALNGAFCLSAEDFSKIKAKAKADCENKKANRAPSP